MSIGKVVQEQFWRKSFPFIEFSSTSASSDASIESFLLLNIVIDGDINLKINFINNFMCECQKKLLIIELSYSFALTKSRFVHEHKKDVDKNVKDH